MICAALKSKLGEWKEKETTQETHDCISCSSSNDFPSQSACSDLLFGVLRYCFVFSIQGF